MATVTVTVSDAANHTATTSVNYTVSAPSSFPDASNTGVPAGTTLTTVSGAQSFNTPNQVIDAKLFTGAISVNAAGVKFTRCKFQNSNYTAVRNYSSGMLTLEDCEISGGNQSFGLGFGNITCRRVYIHGVENGMSMGSNIFLYDSYIANLSTNSGFHTDGIQMDQGANNLTIEHCHIVIPSPPTGTAALIMWDEAGTQVSNVLVNNSLLEGGSYTMYGPRFTGATNVRITNNRFVPGQYGYANNCVLPYITEWTNNKHHITGATLAPA